MAEWSRPVEHICFTRTSGGSSHRWNVPSLQVHLFANEYVTRRFISGCSQKPNASSGVLAHPVIRLLGAVCKICIGSQPMHIKSSCVRKNNLQRHLWMSYGIISVPWKLLVERRRESKHQAMLEQCKSHTGRALTLPLALPVQ